MTDNTLAYITKRFDRQNKKKIGVEDLCQLSLKLTESKYRSSCENVGKIIKKYSNTPGDDILKFYELNLYCFIVGNADMHLKNFSLLTEEDIKLAPCYDLLATKLLIPEHIDPEEVALPINGKKTNLRKKDFIALGENLKIPDKVIGYSIKKMIDSFAKWENKINISFLNDTLKASFKKLIIKNLELFN
jgi:serine/threonine-protein kinase HipA